MKLSGRHYKRLHCLPKKNMCTVFEGCPTRRLCKLSGVLDSFFRADKMLNQNSSLCLLILRQGAYLSTFKEEKEQILCEVSVRTERHRPPMKLSPGNISSFLWIPAVGSRQRWHYVGSLCSLLAPLVAQDLASFY